MHEEHFAGLFRDAFSKSKEIFKVKRIIFLALFLINSCMRVRGITQ